MVLANINGNHFRLAYIKPINIAPENLNFKIDINNNNDNDNKLKQETNLPEDNNIKKMK